MNSSNFDNAYLALLKDNRVYDSSLEESAAIIAKHCAQALSVSRASVWVPQHDASVLQCLSLYNLDHDIYESGAILTEEAFPRYFAALNNERVIDAVNAFDDPRTNELTDSYLIPLDIHSLLDATLRHQGKVRGILCLEMKRQQRNWSKEELMFVASVADLLSQRMIIDDLVLSENKYKGLYENTSEGIVLFRNDRIVDVNPAACRMFRGSKEELMGKTPADLSTKFQHDGHLSETRGKFHIAECLRRNPENFEWIHKRLDGTEFYADLTLNSVVLAGKTTLFALIRDITDKKEAEVRALIANEKLVFRAAHDSLTGLMNREQLHTHVTRIIDNDSGKNTTSKIALLLLDLNRFKEVNDTLGHATGDKVLVKLAHILNQTVSATGGSLFRLGGDEFVAVFDSDNCTEALEDLESILHDSLKTCIDLNDISIELGASIGIALYPQNGNDSHELLRCADVAMYHAKNNNSASSWYDSQNDLNNKRRLAMIVELGTGISDDQLTLHFQPRIHLKTGKITGCEALLRWNHPKHGMVPPGEFLPLAEMSDLIHPLTEWVAGNVVAQLKELHKKGHHIPIAMNISARNLTDSQLIDKLENLIVTENIDPQLLEIEITESALINHPQRAVENLDKLDRLGIQIAIDDFGTGYSSLSYLKKLPLNTLKIDRSFVKDMLTDESDSVIVDSTIDLAHNFSLTVVAEGVEDQATFDALAAKNCDQAQGFFIAKPMPPADFVTWLKNHDHREYTLSLVCG